MSKENPKKPSQGFQIREDKAKDSSVSAQKSEAIDTPQRDALASLGELPHSYGVNQIMLMAQDPHWLFTYWDLDIAKHPGGKLFLRSCDAAAHVEQEVEVLFETRNWYLSAAHANSHYFVELGYYRGDQWHSMGRSNSVQTPPDRISEEDSLDYAALPLHISFQHMLEQLSTLSHPGEPLTAALSRLRKEGKLTGAEALFPDDAFLSRALMEMLLGKELTDKITNGALSSDEAGKLLKEKLEETLHSARSSEISSLAGGILSSGSLSSFLSSWSETPFSSWMQSAFSSWLEQASSSWSHGALSSATLTGMSSWGGGSETSSWGRDFFMHVNAEVIFYGGTDPLAKVWIDGNPIDLQPDGTFRYHFRFPNENYEIPIVAESPDGLEKRSATLHFRRETEKRGGVDDTMQPPHLDTPMGIKSDSHG
ncbi:MAG: DUF4912 domain-containing protein [Chthoniobacterales bacterium]